MDLIYNYQAATDPSPLTLSSEGRVRVQISRASKEGNVMCDYIHVTVPCGTEQEALFADAAGVTAGVDDPDDWSVTSNPEESDGTRTFTFVPKKSASELSSPAVLYVDGIVANTAGEAQVKIQTTYKDEESGPEETESAVLTVQKGKAEFYLRNFLSRKNAQDEIPCTAFQQGETIYLSWESNGDHFCLYVPGKSKALIETDNHFCTIADGIQETTTLILRAGVAGLSPKYLYEALTLQVENCPVRPFGTPQNLELQEIPCHGSWAGKTNINGILMGGLGFDDNASGIGHIEIRVYNGSTSIYEAQSNAMKLNLQQDNQTCAVNQKAYLSVPIPTGATVYVSYLVDWVKPNKTQGYGAWFTFLPYGVGTIESEEGV